MKSVIVIFRNYINSDYLEDETSDMLMLRYAFKLKDSINEYSFTHNKAMLSDTSIKKIIKSRHPSIKKIRLLEAPSSPLSLIAYLLMSEKALIELITKKKQ
jgi:hypothetical protein